jgi:hypothetical protein
MKASKTEANLVSFQLLLNSKNQIVSELKYVADIENLFNKEEAILLTTLINRAKSKLAPLHTHLQNEVKAL